VVRFLSRQGIPENRMAAAGFSKYHPIDPADTPDAYRKNRRIELKLTNY
jgi:chemotaxis protein MotB